MNSLFSSWNHRRLLKELCAQIKAHKGLTLARIAEEVGVAPPYLSNVLAEKSYLSPDQAHRLGRLAGWGDAEINHFLQLIEFERSGDAHRRASLKRQIEQFRAEQLQPKQHLQKQAIDGIGPDEANYFLNPMLKVIHGLIGIPKYANEVAKVAEALRISPRRLKQHLTELERLGFIRRVGSRYEKVKKNFHLPNDSPLCTPHQKLLAAMAHQQLENLPNDEKFQFMVTYSANSEVQVQIREELLQFLKKIEKLVKEAPSEQLFELKIDMFPWG